MTYKLMIAALATALVLVCGCGISDRDATRTRKLDSSTSVVKPSTDTQQLRGGRGTVFARFGKTSKHVSL